MAVVEFGKTFERVSPILMADLVKEFDLTPEQAAGFVGNFGAESGLVSGQQEGWPIGATTKIRGLKGGIDWPQWTGPRRLAFANFVEQNLLHYPSYKASWEFVKRELKTTHKHALEQVRKTTTVKAATETVEAYYEVAGIKHMPSRIAHAERALELYKGAQPEKPVTDPATIETLQRDLAALSKRVTDLAVQVAKIAKDQDPNLGGNLPNRSKIR